MTRKTTKPVAKVLPFAPLHLVETAPKPCSETIAAAEALLEEARTGKLAGFLVVGLRPDHHYMAHAVGSATKRPARLAQPFNELLTVLHTEAAMARQEQSK